MAAVSGRPFVPPLPVYRCLRGFGIDPSLTTAVDLAPISEVLFKVPWEPLQAGPIGEYLEVIDVDPASGCFYEPVDLQHEALLAQDGLAPSEGIPQFHQQMVYAVASLTIRHFELALGRRCLWRAGPPPRGTDPKNDSMFVQRLRIYPHALRERNAYYSPVKIGLLFGYFTATEDEPGDHVPGGLVFTCLSHDIVAHETTHALIDGMHTRFLTPSNPDVRAFHEAFADIVALFQHFTFADIVRQQIASTRGQIRTHENLLGQLAGQFGRSTGQSGALRDAIGTIDPETRQWKPHDLDPTEYHDTMEPHARGAILVAAVFDAFLKIYENRTADLVRLATSGGGVLAAGAIQPDLVGRLAEEASRSAQHVLTMCIRALDYCPPIDITFGEFLRAIITADRDAVRDDDLRYRVAFVEAFRRRGIYPRDLKTLSQDSLLWRTPDSDERQPSRALEDGFACLREHAMTFLFAETGDKKQNPRETVFHLQRQMRWELHEWLKEHFATHPDGSEDARFLGLDHGYDFEVHTARFALRPGPDGDIDAVFLMSVLQERSILSDADQPNSPTMPFEGGAALVVDLRQLRIRYCVRKSINSKIRKARQQEFTATQLEGLRATYFGATAGLFSREPFAVMHRRR
jgi:hypothetical protein